MTPRQRADVLDVLRRAAGVRAGGLSDGRLLQAFLDQRDEEIQKFPRGEKSIRFR